MKSRRLKIALFGHLLGSRNLGVDALTRSHLIMIDEAANALGIDLEADVYTGSRLLPPAARFGKCLFVRHLPNPVYPKRILSNLLKLPALLGQYSIIFDLSEGDSFTDIYGWRRAYVHIMQKILFGLSGSRVVLSPMTIGPFRNFFWRHLASRALRQIPFVFARDEVSAQVAQELKCSQVVVATDLAMALTFDEALHVRQDTECLRVGINVSGLLWTGGYTGRNQFDIPDDYCRTIRKIVSLMETKGGIQVHLVPHVFIEGHVEDDLLPCEALVEEFPNCQIAPIFENAREAKSYISGLDLFIGSRMHSCIAALSAGVPCLPLAYSMKFGGLFNSLGYRRTINLQETGEKDILQGVEKSLEELESMKAEAEAAKRKATRLIECYRDTIREILKEAADE